MKIRWPWQKWRKYELTVNGYKFRAWANPERIEVDWLDCPSPYVPNGYSSVKYMAAGINPISAWVALLKSPVPTVDEVGGDIQNWLDNLEELKELEGQED